MSIRTVLARSSAVVLAYALSAVGIWLMLVVLASGEVSKSVVRHVVWAAFVVAWGAHITMSVAWIINRRLSPAWSAAGTYAALIGLAAVPIGGVLDSRHPGIEQVILGASMAMFGLLLVAPCAVLATRLVNFHRPSSSFAPSGDA